MKVSVIIPAYNCKDTIKRAVLSALSQTVSDLEVIAIDDGSTDGTYDLLTSLAKEDERLKVIRKENSGPADTRNLGIDNAKGEYIAFLDSDDYIENDFFSSLLKRASGCDFDVIAGGYYMENDEDLPPFKKEFLHKSDLRLYSRDDFFKNLSSLTDSHMMFVVWNKLFKREMLKANNIKFQNFLSGEDRLFNLDVFKVLNSFLFVNRPFYHYVLYKKDTLNNRFVKNRFEAAKLCFEKNLALFEDDEKLFLENEGSICFTFIKNAFSEFCQLHSKGCDLSYKQKRLRIKEILNDEKFKYAILKSEGQFSYSKLVTLILKTKNITLIYLTSKLITFMQSNLRPLFIKLKHSKK